MSNTTTTTERIASDGKRKETLLYRQSSFDLAWRLYDANGFCLGTFPSPAFVRQWCDDNGYACRQG